MSRAALSRQLDRVNGDDVAAVVKAFLEDGPPPLELAAFARMCARLAILYGTAAALPVTQETTAPAPPAEGESNA